MDTNELTGAIIGAAIDVHRELGPGLLESSYEHCMAHELRLREIPFERQVSVPVRYKSLDLDCGYRVDFIVAGCVVVELKSVTALDPIHTAQVLTYLKHSGCRIGLLLNFNVPVLTHGIRRIVL